MRSIGVFYAPFVPCASVVEAPKDSALLNAVFTDEDGNPRSDIGVYQSAETSPEVRNFVSNLMRSVGETENLPDKMRNDDAILQALPNHGETLNQYEQRVNDMVEQEKISRKNAKNEKRLKEALEKVGIKD